MDLAIPLVPAVLKTLASPPLLLATHGAPFETDAVVRIVDAPGAAAGIGSAGLADYSTMSYLMAVNELRAGGSLLDDWTVPSCQRTSHTGRDVAQASASTCSSPSFPAAPFAPLGFRFFACLGF